MVTNKLTETVAPLRLTRDDKLFLNELALAFNQPVASIMRGSIRRLRNHPDPIKELASCI